MLVGRASSPGGIVLITEPRSTWSEWVDRVFSWGVLTAIVAVALVGLALLTTIKHPLAGASRAPVTVLMSTPIDSPRPSIELGKRLPPASGPCNAAESAARTGPCAKAATDPARAPGSAPGH